MRLSANTITDTYQAGIRNRILTSTTNTPPSYSYLALSEFISPLLMRGPIFMPRLKVRHSVLKVICGNDITPKQRQIHTMVQVKPTSAKDRCYDLLCADHCEHSLCWAENISAKTRRPAKW